MTEVGGQKGKSEKAKSEKPNNHLFLSIKSYPYGEYYFEDGF
jgi:hypothetical protein